MRRLLCRLLGHHWHGAMCARCKVVEYPPLPTYEHRLEINWPKDASEAWMKAFSEGFKREMARRRAERERWAA